MLQEPKSPLPPLFQREELTGSPLKVPLLKRGISGDLKTLTGKEFLANTIRARKNLSASINIPNLTGTTRKNQGYPAK
jgi:hypothetical protein